MKSEIFTLKGLDCANCAASLEMAIKKLDGIEGCSIAFLTQRLKVETIEGVSDALLAKIAKAVKRAGCKIIEDAK